MMDTQSLKQGEAKNTKISPAKLVRAAGIEPALRYLEKDFKSFVSTYSTTLARDNSFMQLKPFFQAISTLQKHFFFCYHAVVKNITSLNYILKTVAKLFT